MFARLLASHSFSFKYWKALQTYSASFICSNPVSAYQYCQVAVVQKFLLCSFFLSRVINSVVHQITNPVFFKIFSLSRWHAITIHAVQVSFFFAYSFGCHIHRVLRKSLVCTIMLLFNVILSVNI